MSAPSPDRVAFEAWFAASTFESMGEDWEWSSWQASRRQALEDAARALEAEHETRKHYDNSMLVAARLVRALIEPGRG